MANTLYDLLEVSQSASAETISAAYQRLRGLHTEQAAGGDEDATNRLIALREAFSTLSDPGRRQRYDDGLIARELSHEAAPASRPFLKLVVIAIIVGFFGLTYSRHQTAQQVARLETERLAATAKQAEAEARMAEVEARRATEERLAADREERKRLRDEAMERSSRERDIAYGQQISRNLERAEAESQRAKWREEQQKEQAERQKIREAESQLAREKAYLRQIEMEKRRSGY
jgi:curved DNA-binding protein CbpA